MTTGGTIKSAGAVWLLSHAGRRAAIIVGERVLRAALAMKRRTLDLEAEKHDLLAEVTRLEAEVATLAASARRLEDALTDAHGVIYDLGPDPIAEQSAVDAAAELRRLARKAGGGS